MAGNAVKTVVSSCLLTGGKFASPAVMGIFQGAKDRKLPRSFLKALNYRGLIGADCRVICINGLPKGLDIKEAEFEKIGVCPAQVPSNPLPKECEIFAVPEFNLPRPQTLPDFFGGLTKVLSNSNNVWNYWKHFIQGWSVMQKGKNGVFEKNVTSQFIAVNLLILKAALEAKAGLAIISRADPACLCCGVGKTLVLGHEIAGYGMLPRFLALASIPAIGIQELDAMKY